MTIYTITFGECEHGGDMDMYLADVARCGGRVVRRWLHADEMVEEGYAEVEMADLAAFRAALDATETGPFASISAPEPATRAASKPVKTANATAPDAWAVNTPVTIVTGKLKGRHGVITAVTARSVTVTCYTRAPLATRTISRSKIAQTLVKRSCGYGDIYR